MRRIRLTTAEQEQVEHLFKTTNGGLDGEPGSEAQDHCSRFRGHHTTVRRWLKQYHDRGLVGLQIHWAPGQPRRIPKTLVPTIQEWVKAGPAGCGLDRANWTYEELATYLYQTTGITVKRTAMRDFCQRHAIRPYRPTYRYWPYLARSSSTYGGLLLLGG